MTDSKEENFLVFETRLAGRSLPMACLLLFGGSRALSVPSLWYGVGHGVGQVAWGPLGVLTELHSQGPGWRGSGALGQPLCSCAGPCWSSCRAVPSEEAPGPVPSEPLTAMGPVCRGEGGPGARPVGSAAWSLQVTVWMALVPCFSQLLGNHTPPHSGARVSRSFCKLSASVSSLISSPAAMPRYTRLGLLNRNFTKKEAEGKKECANLMHWKQARSPRYCQETGGTPTSTKSSL